MDYGKIEQIKRKEVVIISLSICNVKCKSQKKAKISISDNKMQRDLKSTIANFVFCCCVLREKSQEKWKLIPIL